MKKMLKKIALVLLLIILVTLSASVPFEIWIDDGDIPLIPPSELTGAFQMDAQGFENYYIGHPVTGKMYYISDSDGNDANSGMSPEDPWKTLGKAGERVYGAGDVILLKAGDIWNDQQLKLRGSGAAGSPIRVDRYGEGSRPRINGSGTSSDVKYWPNENKPFSAAVEIWEGSHWIVRNLEVTNYDVTAGSRPTGIRSGIAVLDSAASSREYKATPQGNITIQDCYVRDVISDPQEKRSGGIIIIGNYSDVTIDGNLIENVSVTGIRNASASKQAYGGFKLFYLANYKFSNNTLINIAGDAIVMDSVSGGVMEYNTVDQYCTGDPTKFYAGVWTWSCKNVVIQYNEIANAIYGNDDGKPFDVDWYNENILIQYNYTHGNRLGFAIFSADVTHTGNSYGTVFRYNISINDGYVKDARIFQYGIANNLNAPLIYNNIIYQTQNLTTRYLFQNYTKGLENLNLQFYNNIVIGPKTMRMTGNAIGGGSIASNVFFPASLAASTGSIGQNNIALDKDPFAGMISADNIPSGLITAPDTFDTSKLDFFNTDVTPAKAQVDHLLPESIPPATLDFFGNTVGKILQPAATPKYPR